MNLLVSKWIRSCDRGGKKPCQRVMWTALETPELLWRRVFEALMGSWRLCSTSDMLKQTPLHKMQMGSVWVLAKYGKRCSGRFISRSTKSPPLNGNPGLFSHPELEGARLLYVLGRVRRNYVYSGNRLPQSHLLSLFTTSSQTSPLKSSNHSWQATSWRTTTSLYRCSLHILELFLRYHVFPWDGEIMVMHLQPFSKHASLCLIK